MVQRGELSVAHEMTACPDIDEIASPHYRVVDDTITRQNPIAGDEYQNQDRPDDPRQPQSQKGREPMSIRGGLSTVGNYTVAPVLERRQVSRSGLLVDNG